MAGKGTEVGGRFEELREIIDRCRYPDRMGVCLDTCHVYDAGYDIVHDFEGVIGQFDQVLGKEQIAVFHINDSKNVRGAAKDRHENIGYGKIGFKPLHYIVHHPQLSDIPKILETPYVGTDKNNKKAPYKYEIDMLKDGNWTNFQEIILGQMVES